MYSVIRACIVLIIAIVMIRDTNTAHTINDSTVSFHEAHTVSAIQLSSETDHVVISERFILFLSAYV